METKKKSNKINIFKHFFWGTIAFSLFFYGCAPSISIKYSMETLPSLDKSTPPKQEQGAITVELTPITNIKKEYEKPYFTQTLNVYQNPLLGTPGLYDVTELISYFENMTPFEATIVNNTNHILRMGDARIVFIDANGDDPVMALSMQEVMENLTSLPSFKYMLSTLSDKYAETKPAYLAEQLTKAMLAVSKEIKFVNGLNREILPGMSFHGLIVFPVEPKRVAEGKVSLIDLVSETDQAGNPTKKVRFDYRLNTYDKFWRLNSATDKDWVEINKDEYDAGVNGAKK